MQVVSVAVVVQLREGGWQLVDGRFCCYCQGMDCVWEVIY